MAQRTCLGCWALFAVIVAAGDLFTQEARSAVTSEPDAPLLRDARNVVAAINDPWIFAVVSMGIVFEMKESRVMSLCKTGTLIKIEELDAGGKVVETEEPDKNGKLANVPYVPPWPHALPPTRIYEQGTQLSQAPTPAPESLSRICGGDSGVLASLKTGMMNAYAAGMLVTKDDRILFWQMEDLNTISLTSDGRKWYFLQSDLSPAEALKDLSYSKRYYGPAGPIPPGQPPEVPLTPPLASDVAAICNYPPVNVGPSLRYEVDKATILQFLKSGKALKTGRQPFREMDATVGEFGSDTRDRLQAMNERDGAPLMPNEYVRAKGILVTRNNKFYIWLLHGDKALYLTDFKDHCWLMLN